jgi:hypothetical protein
MRNFILAVGMFMIILVSFCAIDKDNIEYYFVSKSIEHKYGTTSENAYFLEDNFNYVDNYTEAKISSRKELLDSLYYIINSGQTYAEKYCDIEYTNCISDLESIVNDNEILSTFNNFTHPYNSFESIEFSHNDRTITISINHTYNNDDINTINNIVDEVISEKITNDMTTKEKIKVIHDYIIDIADYDSLKSNNINDTTYKSNTAYGVLVQGKGICSGYSDTMAIFLDKLNIINYKISTTDHIWNFVYVDGAWYHLDLTWDDPISDKNISRDKFFLITTSNLEYIKEKEYPNDETHNFDKEIYSEAK